MSKQPAAPEIDGGRCRFERLMPAHARTHPHPHTPAHTEVCHVPAQRQQRRPFRCQTSEITSRSPPAGLWAVSPAPVCAYVCVRTRVCESRHTHTHTHKHRRPSFACVSMPQCVTCRKKGVNIMLRRYVSHVVREKGVIIMRCICVRSPRWSRPPGARARPRARRRLRRMPPARSHPLPVPPHTLLLYVDVSMCNCAYACMHKH